MGGNIGATPGDLFAAWASLQLQLDAHRPRHTEIAGPNADAPADADGGVATRTTPVCLLTGFLGAGKSTVLASLLADAEPGFRATAIVNDVGALPFDPTLVDWADDVRVELANGCGCCQSGARLADTLRDVAAAEPPWDLIVIEASGAADPLALAQIVEAEATVTLDRIVTVVPATGVGSQPLGPVRSIMDRQIESAHCIIVSHCDLVSESDADDIVARLERSAPGRTITPSSLDSPATQVLFPTAPRGARLLSDFDANVHRDLIVETVSACRHVAADELRRVLLAARPGLVRVKGRLVIDGRARVIQMTPQSIDISTDEGATADHPTGITLIAADESAIRPVLQLLTAAPA